MKRLLIVLALCASSIAVAAPASATECTPKGCSGGCTINREAAMRVDPATGTVTIDPLIVCYS